MWREIRGPNCRSSDRATPIPLTVAEAVERVRAGPELRDFLVRRGVCRASDFDVARSSARFAAVLGQALGAA